MISGNNLTLFYLCDPYLHIEKEFYSRINLARNDARLHAGHRRITQ